MLWRKKSESEVSDDHLHPDRPGAKNRPTPKRRDQEAANQRPLVVTDRKAASKANREARRSAYAKQRQAMLTGDEANLPERDKGPVRRYLRDYVDARWSVGEFLLPIMLLVLLLSFVRTTTAMLIVFFAVYSLVLVAIADGFVMWRRLKRQLVEKFGENAIPRGSVMYAVMRAFQIRRSRMPRPQVARGEYPH